MTRTAAAYRDVIKRLDELERRYDTALEKIRRRLATGVSILIVAGEWVLIVPDGTLGDSAEDRIASGVTAFVMMCGFALANEMLLSDRLRVRLTGRLAWIATLCAFPVMLMAGNDWSLGDLFAKFRALPTKQ